MGTERNTYATAMSTHVQQPMGAGSLVRSMRKARALSVLVLCGMHHMLAAQVTSVTVETSYTDDGTVAGYPAGHSTYRIYAQLTHATDRLTSVYGGSDAPLLVNASGSGFWNHAEAGPTASQNDCSLHGAAPAMAYDSYLAIGSACNGGTAGTVYALDDPNTTTWIDEAFGTAPYGMGTVAVTTQVGALWYSLQTASDTQAGDELRVLVAQITTDGAICGTLNFQVFPEYAGPGSPYIQQTGFSFSSLENGITITPEVVPPTCHGDEDASIVVSAAGGTGMLAYSFDNITYAASASLEGLGAGTYPVYVRDEAGCTVALPVRIADPAVLGVAGLEAIDITGALPGGNTAYTVQGGVPPYSFYWTGAQGNVVSASQDLPPLSGQDEAGTYTLVITDEAGCAFNTAIEVSFIVGMEELAFGHAMEVFPNPTPGLFTLHFRTAGSMDVSYRIMDASGRSVLSSRPGIVSGERYEPVDISHLAAGVYFLRTETGQGSRTVRIIKHTAP